MPFITRLVASQYRSLPPAPRKDMRGRVFIITGANSGIGLEIAYHLAACQPAKLILAVRNVKAGEVAKASIIERYPNTANSIEVWYVDMASFSSLKPFADRCESLDRLDGVAMNAGIQGGKWETTEDGHESVSQVNVISPFILAVLLIPILRRTAPLANAKGAPAPPRILFTGSLAAEQTKTKLIDPKAPLRGFDDKSRFEKVGSMDRYFQSKLALHSLVESLIALYPDLVFTDVQPGLIVSPFHKNLNGFEMFATRTLGRSPEEGARSITTAMLTLDKSVDWFQDCRVMKSHFDWLRTQSGHEFSKNLVRDCAVELEKAAPGTSATAGLKL